MLKAKNRKLSVLLSRLYLLVRHFQTFWMCRRLAMWMMLMSCTVQVAPKLQFKPLVLQIHQMSDALWLRRMRESR